MSNNLRMHALLSLTATAFLVAGCGGGGGSTPATPIDPVVAGTDVPVTATSSTAGAVAFVSSKVAASDNSAEPITVGDVALATSDTEEPDSSI